MIKVKGVSDAKIKAQGVELGDWPDRVEAQAWGNNKIILRVSFGVVNVVVVFGSDGHRNVCLPSEIVTSVSRYQFFQCSLLRENPSPRQEKLKESSYRVSFKKPGQPDPGVADHWVQILPLGPL